MLKKIVTLLLSAALALSPALPAFAAPPANDAVGASTAETAQTAPAPTPVAAPAPRADDAGGDAAPLTAAEKAYTRVGLYDEAVYDALFGGAGGETAPDGEEKTAALASLGSYNEENAAAAFRFLTSELGLNAAQACGIMASMYTESRFDPTAYNGNDTGGTISYGLCQWNSTRYESLMSWCAANGYDYTTMDGQLHYLQYEVNSTERRAWSYMQNIPNTADGAYTAGYNWARYFERGASRYWESRAVLSRDDFWPRYCNFTAVPTPQPVDTTMAQAFVTRLYQVCLGRTPDPAGLADWTGKIVSGKLSGTQAAFNFVFSPEFTGKNYCNQDYVSQLYLAFLGRNPDGPGLAGWVARLENGESREAVFNGFAGSSEFAAVCQGYGNIPVGSAVPLPAPGQGTVPHGTCALCGTPDGATRFVTRLYQVCLDREPDITGLVNWNLQLWGGAMGGSGVARNFIFSKEFTAKNYDNTTFVTYLYKAFLDREPDGAGLAGWAAKLQGGATRESVFNGFAGSDEFTALCKKYGIARD